MFGRSVNGRPWRCPLTQRRRDIDDTTSPLRDHDFEFMLKPQKGTEDVGIESRGVTFYGLINERPRVSFGSRIIDRDINASEALNGLINQIVHIFLDAHIGTDIFSFRA